MLGAGNPTEPGSTPVSNRTIAVHLDPTLPHR